MLDFLFRRARTRHTIHLEGRNEPISARPGETLLEAALRAGVRFPNDCRVGACGTCKCRLVEGAVRERTDKSYTLSREELEAGFVLACQSEPRADVRVVVPDLVADAGGQRPVTLEGAVESVTQRTHDIVELVVRVPTPLPYVAGQYARLSSPSHGTPSRCYSFARAPRTAGGETSLAFYVREVPGGALSPRLVRDARAGMPLVVEGPFGDFRLRDAQSPVLAIAGGSGLAPIRALVEDLVRHKSSRRVTVLFGARTARDLYDAETFGSLARASGRAIAFVPVLSAEAEGSAWSGARGLVSAAIADHLAPGAHAYLAGPPPMIDACLVELERLGVPRDRVAFDRFTDARDRVARTPA